MRDIDQLRREFKEQGYALFRYDDGNIHSYPYDSPWLTDEDFNRIYAKVRGHTLVDRVRCYSLYLLLERVKGLAGDALEVGTWQGGTAGILAKCLPEKTVYLADTFEGVVKAAEWEHYKNGAHSDTSVAAVEQFLVESMEVSNYHILRGIFPEETGQQIADRTFSFVHLDLDVYRSTKDAFNFIWDRLSERGIVVFDDYGMISACEGISVFVNEIKNDRDKIFVPNLNGQAYVIKV